MRDQDLIFKIQLALMGRASRIKDLEGVIKGLTIELQKTREELAFEKENKIAKLTTDEEKLT